MTVSPMSDNLNIIAALSDRPNATDGLTAAQLKAKYDQGPGLIKTYINGTLVTALNSASPDGQYAADAGSTDAYAVTLSPVPSAYFTGMVIRFKANTANTGACSLNANSLGTVAIKKKHDQDLRDNDIESGQIVEVVHDGTNFQMLSPTANNAQDAWISPTLLNGWVNSGGGEATAGYYKDDFNMVRVSGLIKSGTTTAGTVLLTLPAGYRPALIEERATLSWNGTTIVPVFLNVQPGGNLTISVGAPGNTFMLVDITFRAEQ
jgi:hypothetical protein